MNAYYRHIGHMLCFNTEPAAKYKVILEGSRFEDLTEFHLNALARILFDDLTLTHNAVQWVAK